MNRILKNKNSLREIFSRWHPLHKIEGIFYKASDVNFAKNKNIFQSKKTKAIMIALVLMLVFLTTTEIIHAAGAGTDAASAVASAIGTAASAPFIWAFKSILTGIQTLVGWLFGIAATLFAFIVDPANVSGPTGILNKQAVKDVWIMTRDVLNMTFILILLFAAFCTIFQVEKWNLKKVWLSILINALLVNFSYPIARFFIDVSNVAMYYFINHLFTATGTVNGSSIMASFGGVSNITDILMPKDFASNSIAYQMAMISFTFLFGMTLLVVAILFVIRLLALTLLVMFSPIGFVGYIFPETKKFADDWWKKLFEYSFFGPIMIFMMAVALQVAKAIGQDNFKSFMSTAGVNSPTAEANWIANAAFFMIPVIILWMGMGVAKSMGIAGADAVVSKAQAISKGAYNMFYGNTAAAWFGAKAVPAMLKAGGRKLDRSVLAPMGISPRAFMEGWKARRQDLEDKALKPAAGAWRDRLGKVFSFGKEKSHYKDMEEENLLNKELKEMESYATNDEYLVEEIKGLKGKKDARSQAKAAAAIRMLFKNNDQNEFMKKLGMDGDGTKGSGTDRNPFTTKEALIKLFGKEGVGMSEEQVGRNLYQLGEIALSKGNIADYGMGEYKNGKYQASSDESQKSAAASKFVNMGSQEKMKSMHWNSILTETKDGGVGKVHETGKMLLNNLTAAEIKQTGRARADFLQKMSDPAGRKSLLEFVNSKECTNEETVLALLKEIDGLNLKKKEGKYDGHSLKTEKEEEAEYKAYVDDAKKLKS